MACGLSLARFSVTSCRGFVFLYLLLMATFGLVKWLPCKVLEPRLLGPGLLYFYFAGLELEPVG